MRETTASCCPTIAHAPNPSRAMASATPAPRSVAAISRSSRLLKAISRTSSALWVVPIAATRKLTESTAIIGRISGSLKNDAIDPKHGARCKEGEPRATLVQKAVEQSSWVSDRRWTSAWPSARSEKMNTKLVKTSTIPARPYSWGARIRASTIATARRVSWIETCAVPFHARPRTTSGLSSSPEVPAGPAYAVSSSGRSREALFISRRTLASASHRRACRRSRRPNHTAGPIAATPSNGHGRAGCRCLVFARCATLPRTRFGPQVPPRRLRRVKSRCSTSRRSA